MGRTVVGYRGAGPHDLPAFVIAFQPIVDLSTRSIVAYEALTRGANGACYPQLVAHLSAAALRAFHRRTAEAAIRRAAELGIKQLHATLCINLQPDLSSDALDAEFILGAAERYGLNASHILLEFTEHHRLDISEYKQLMKRNRDAGFATGMDDFGAGYSGLSTLVEARPEVLKLDRALIQGIDTSYTRQKIVAAFSDCCKALDMRVIAEGIETVAECDMLTQVGVTHMQGYLFSRPVVDALPTHSVWGIEPQASPHKQTYRPSLLAALGLDQMLARFTLPA